MMRGDQTKGGLRPFDLSRDMGPVTDLLEVAFGEGLSAEGKEAVRAMRAMARFGPFLWLLSLLGLDGFLSGYVWEEGGHLVGHITLSKDRLRGGYLISNLAVDPQFRRRGIAKGLMRAALEEAKDREAPWVALEVRRNNLAAKSLYRGLGFQEVDAFSLLRIDGIGSVDFVPHPDFQIRESKDEDEGEAYLLWRKGLPEEALWLGVKGAWRPQGGGRLSWWLSFGRWRWYGWVAEREGKFLGLLSLRASYGSGPHRLRMVVHPQWRGEVEESLLAKALSLMEAGPQRRIVAELYPSYVQVREVFERYGFTEVETLERMILKWEEGDDHI